MYGSMKTGTRKEHSVRVPLPQSRHCTGIHSPAASTAPRTRAASATAGPAARHTTSVHISPASAAATWTRAFSAEVAPLATVSSSGCDPEQPLPADDDAAAAVCVNCAQGRWYDGPWPARCLLITTAALYGTDYITLKLVQQDLEPAAITPLRFALATLIFSPYLRSVPFKTLRNGLELGLWFGLGFCAQILALESTSASKTAFIYSLCVVWVPILDSLYALISRIRLRNVSAGKGLPITCAINEETDGEAETSDSPSGLIVWTSALVALVGVACLVLNGWEKPTTGDLWALVQPLGFGTGFWRMEAMAKQSSGGPEASAQLTAAMVLGVTLISGTWAATAKLDFRDIGYTLTHSWLTVAVLAWAGVVTSAVTNVLEAMALVHVSASECMIILSSEPLWTTLFAMVALSERLSANTALGAALITIACLWSALGDMALSSCSKSRPSSPSRAAAGERPAVIVPLLSLHKDV
eukprot:TRINITY_DN6440_c0_g1_i1.p1 TRINITY_DN6440_c0_g1~~TRINITY_DN6440_c0_g1_i1.p1  ORF type:complete len:470 (-),score=93.44 TRINITY_DN6440_c0_g1_i1:270-1679(-)